MEQSIQPPASPNPPAGPAPTAQLRSVLPSRDEAGKAAGGEDHPLTQRGAQPEIAPAPWSPGQGTFLRRSPHPPRRGMAAWSLCHVRPERWPKRKPPNLFHFLPNQLQMSLREGTATALTVR